MRPHLFSLLAALLPLTAMTACSDMAPPGQVALALSAESSGTTYRLRDAQFDLANGDTVTVLRSEDFAPDAGTISVDLDPGAYQISLQAGWRLERVVEGVAEPVEASMVSDNPVAAGVLQGERTAVTFVFRLANGDVVPMTPSGVDIGIDVLEPTVTNCPAPEAGNVSVCGTLSRLADGRTVPAGEVTLRAYDGLQFTQGGMATEPLALTGVLDSEGVFQVEIAAPALGFLALVALDAGSGEWRPTAVILAVTAGAAHGGIDLPVIDAALVQGWTAAAVDPIGSDSESGAVLLRYRHADGSPASGVTATVGGNAAANSDFYFEDGAETFRTLSPDSNLSGANGGALLVGSELVEHSGQGGERDDCGWDSVLAARAPGALVVADIVCLPY